MGSPRVGSHPKGVIVHKPFPYKSRAALDDEGGETEKLGVGGRKREPFANQLAKNCLAQHRLLGL